MKVAPKPIPHSSEPCLPQNLGGKLYSDYLVTHVGVADLLHLAQRQSSIVAEIGSYGVNAGVAEGGVSAEEMGEGGNGTEPLGAAGEGMGGEEMEGEAAEGAGEGVEDAGSGTLEGAGEDSYGGEQPEVIREGAEPAEGAEGEAGSGSGVPQEQGPP